MTYDEMFSSPSSSASSTTSSEPLKGNEQNDDVLTLYVRAGCDNKKYGACPFCQRIFMVLMLKAATSKSKAIEQYLIMSLQKTAFLFSASLKFKVATVPKTILPSEFKRHGLRNLPAIIHGEEAIDTVEEIVDYIESEFPDPPQESDFGLCQTDVAVDRLARNFFSKFCYYIKAVSKDSTALDAELRRLDTYLTENCYDRRFACGNRLSHLDCELLPKLHHMRVAAAKLKRFEIPASYAGLWRYLNHAYNEECFVKSCPPDQEIVLHWADRPDTPNLSYEERSGLTRNAHLPRFSFDVPAIATLINLP